MTKSLVESQGYIDITNGTSEDFNKLMKSFSIDISNVFDASNKNENEIKKNHDALVQENLFLYRKIKSIEAKMNSVLTACEVAQGMANNYAIFKTSFSGNDISNVSTLHDSEYGIMTLPYKDSQQSSINIFPKEFLIKNIDITVEYSLYDASDLQVGGAKLITLSSDYDLLNIIDMDSASYWHKMVEVDDSIARVEFKTTVTLPSKMVSSLFVNSIGIKPHPIYSLVLKDVSYTAANSGEKKTIPTYPKVVDINSQAMNENIKDLDNIKFMFPVVMASKVEVVMSQNSYVKVGDKKYFVIGLRGIDIENMNITSEEASFVTEIRIPGDGQYFKKVLEPETTMLVESGHENLVSHELLDRKDAEIPMIFGSDIGANYNTLYVRTTLKRDGETIPAVKGIKYGYMPKNS